MDHMRITLDRSVERARRVPLSRQIQLHVQRLISERLLGPGVKLPATRELARDLGVNRTTVAVAYDDLVAAGFARAHVGQGTFVAGSPGVVSGRGDRRTAVVDAGGRVNGAVSTPARPSIDWSALLSRSARVVGENDVFRAGLARA